MGNLVWLVSSECRAGEMIEEIRSYAAVVSFCFVLLKPTRQRRDAIAFASINIFPVTSHQPIGSAKYYD